MVCKDEIIDWFRHQPSHERLDVLCTLASMCLPFEIRFLNTCVDFLARKDAPAAKDSEVLTSIDKSQIAPNEADLHDESLRRKLILKLTLLHAGNRLVAHTIFQTLCNISADLKVVGLGMMNSEIGHELHLIFTMVLHHPSFTLEERVKLGEIYLCMQSQYPVQRPSSATTNSPSPVSLYGSSPLSSPVPDLEPAKTATINPVTVTSNSAVEISERPANSPSRKQSQSLTAQREPRRNHQRNCGSYPDGRNQSKNGHVHHSHSLTNGVDFITQQIKEQLGKAVPKCWHKLEGLSVSELINLTDQQFQDMGLPMGSIGRLRKTLKNICQNNYKASNGALSSSNSSMNSSSNVSSCNSSTSSNCSSSSNEGLTAPSPLDRQNQSPEWSHSSSNQSQPFQSVLMLGKFSTVTSSSTAAAPSSLASPSSTSLSSSSSSSSSTSSCSLTSSTPRSALLKTGCMGPPNVQPAFNNCLRPSVSRDVVDNPLNAAQPAVQEPGSRAGSSNSTVSSLENCSPPSSPTEPNKNKNSTAHKHRKPVQHFNVGCAPNSIHSPVAQSLGTQASVSGSRHQSRAPCSTPSSMQGPLRGANNNTSYMRPSPSPTYITSSSSNAVGGSGSGSNSNSNNTNSSSSGSTSTISGSCNNGAINGRLMNNRAASQPRELCYTLNISYSGGGPQQPQQQPSASFILDSTTPPPNLETGALPVYPYHHSFYSVHGDGIQAQSLGQPQTPFAFIPSGPPPSNSSLGNRPPLTGPHDMPVYPPTSYFVQGHIVPQPIAPPHGSNANVRPSLLDIQTYLPPGPLLITTRPDAADFSRPPPPGSNGGGSVGGGSVSCFNCGATGHRGTQCKETSLEDIIKPAPLV